jgi:hypothetical protein
MKSSECCGNPIEAVSMETVRGTLSLFICGRCERRRWAAGGREAPLEEILGTALRNPTRHLVLVPALSDAA